MRQEPHPDELANQVAAKEIHRGGMQAADDKAMEAYWRAIDEGKSKEEAAVIFFNIYLKIVHGK